MPRPSIDQRMDDGQLSQLLSRSVDESNFQLDGLERLAVVHRLPREGVVFHVQSGGPWPDRLVFGIQAAAAHIARSLPLALLFGRFDRFRVVDAAIVERRTRRIVGRRRKHDVADKERRVFRPSLWPRAVVRSRFGVTRVRGTKRFTILLINPLIDPPKGETRVCVR